MRKVGKRKRKSQAGVEDDRNNSHRTRRRRKRLARSYCEELQVASRKLHPRTLSPQEGMGMGMAIGRAGGQAGRLAGGQDPTAVKDE